MQGAYVKISVSMPDEIYGFLKTKSKAGGTPISRLVAQAVSRMAVRETKAKTKGGARK
jgi:hypothetical protein